VSNKAALDQEVERLIRNRFPNRKASKHPIESDERRVLLDSFVMAQFEPVGESGESTPKCAPSEFWIAAQKLTGWTKETVSSTARPRSEAEVEFKYLTNAFLGIWVELPVDRKLDAEQGAERRELVRKNSLAIHEFLKDHGGDSARCVLANWLIQRWCSENNPELLCEAKALYENAADAGSLEALYSLGAAELLPAGAKYMVPKPSPVFLIDDELLRRDYIERAAIAGYQEAVAHLANEENARRNLLEEDLWHSQYGIDAQDEHDEWEAAVRRSRECDLPQLRAFAESGDLDVACHLAEWLLQSAKDIRSRRHPGFIDRSDGFLELNADAEPTASDYERQARELIELGVSKEYPFSLRVLAEESSFGIDKPGRFNLLMKAAFPTNPDYESDFFAIQSLAWLEYEPDQYEDADRVMRLWISIRPPGAYDGTELKLAKICEEKGAFDQAELLLRDHLKHRKAKDHTEIRLARLIRSHLSDSGARSREVLDLLESIANVSGEAAMLSGLMRLRGDGCEADRDLAKMRFEQCKAIQKRPGQAIPTTQEAVYVDIVLALGWGGENSLYAATEALLKIAYKKEFKGTNVPGPDVCDIFASGNRSLKQYGDHVPMQFDYLQFCLDDAFSLWDGNAALATIDELDVLRPEFGNVQATWVLLNSLLAAVLSEWRYDKSGLIAIHMEKVTGIGNLVPKSSMVWSFLVGMLNRSGRVEGASMSDAIVSLERVIELDRNISEAEKEESPQHLIYKGLRRWIVETTLEVLPYARKSLVEQQENTQKLAEQKRQADIEVAKVTAIAKQKSLILSALAHTLHNSLGTGPEIVRSAIRILGTNPNGLTRLQSAAINDLTTLFTTFEFTEQLIQSFKLQVSDPDKLSEEVMRNEPDLPSLGNVIIHGLRQVVARTLFKDTYLKRAFHLAGSLDNKALIGLRADFRREIISGEGEASAVHILEWIKTCLPGLSVTIDPEAFRYPLHNKMQHSLIFTLVSELLLNAVRHAGDGGPIQVTLSSTSKTMNFSVRNAVVGKADKEAIAIGDGGLTFIGKLADDLTVPGFFEAEFNWDLCNGIFQAELSLTDERMG
jgi:hypothetical protein